MTMTMIISIFLWHCTFVTSQILAVGHINKLSGVTKLHAKRMGPL